MKKLILFLAIISGIHFANAQTNTTRGTASINLQKIEEISEPEQVKEEVIKADSLTAPLLTSDAADVSHNKKGFTEMEFDSWNMYYAMMANDNLQYNSMDESSGKRRMTRKYAKAAYAIDPK